MNKKKKITKIEIISLIKINVASKSKQAERFNINYIGEKFLLVSEWSCEFFFLYSTNLTVTIFKRRSLYPLILYTHTSRLDFNSIQIFFYCILFFLHNHNNNNKITTTVSLFQIQNNMQNVKCLWPKDGVVTKTQ